MKIKFAINGETIETDVEPRLLLVHFLRDQFVAECLLLTPNGH